MRDFTEFYQQKNTVSQYDKIRLSGFKQGVNREIELIVLSKILKGKSILEIGPGTGFITQILEKKGAVTAIDTSKAMINTAKKLNKKTKFINKGIFEYSTKKKFDAVVTFRVLGHFSIEDLDKALGKIHSLLKKKGTLIFNLENHSIIRQTIRLFRKNRVETYQYSKQEISEILRKNGFYTLAIIPTDHFWILSPFYLLNKLFLGKFRNAILNLEKKLLFTPFSNVNWIIKCKKN
jgi:2-polyprenyl-3-methyl-5-hydroxy-6-metoxy-1,4-benzoquinol methylase